MLFWKTVLLVSCFIILYNYAGYALFVLCLNFFIRKKQKIFREEFYPSISFIVAAYNEEDCIEKKIKNSLEQIYPAEKIEFIFITDGSTDSTPQIIKKFSSVQLLHSNQRKGKSAALNRAVEHARNEILIFSDANTTLNPEACLRISRHYSDKSVGGVAGEKKIISDQSQDATEGEGLYWKYESTLKKIDSDFYSVVGAAGELFSVRTVLYQAVPSKVILDDFIISMKIAIQGYRVIYEPGAFATELPSLSIEDERERKVRIAAGGFQSMLMLPEGLFFWRLPKLSFLYVSHRVLRWTLAPVCLILALLSNIILVIFCFDLFYAISFFVQALFYLSAFVYSLFPALGKKVSFLKLPYYFIFMNISVIQGLFRFIQNKQSATWEKAKRNNPESPLGRSYKL